MPHLAWRWRGCPGGKRSTVLDLKLDVVTVSRQLGHARPSITSDVYAHVFDQARHAESIRERMAANDFGKLLEAPST